MDYRKLYNGLVSFRTLNPLNKSKVVYTERHHIVPKCLGGSNSKENLVRLTGREHFLAHRILNKIYPDNADLKTALFLMCKSNRSNVRRVDSKLYEHLKTAQAKRMSALHKGKKWSKGKTHSIATRDKISSSQKGKVLSVATKEKMSYAKSATWLITHPYGADIIYKGSLEIFCDLNDISKQMMQASAGNNGVICTATVRQITQISRDTVGWGCRKISPDENFEPQK